MTRLSQFPNAKLLDWIIQAKLTMLQLVSSTPLKKKDPWDGDHATSLLLMGRFLLLLPPGLELEPGGEAASALTGTPAERSTSALCLLDPAWPMGSQLS